jgi:hypothetical protein
VTGELETADLTAENVERFWGLVVQREADQCWPWEGGRLQAGYGRFHAQGQAWRAHRVAYELTNGVIEGDAHLDHLCHNASAHCPGGALCLHRRCVNPSHLAPVTLVENVMRGRSQAAQNARKTRCKRGHDLVEGNLYRSKNGRRLCAICGRAQVARSRRRRRERQGQ